jgi:site-specific recombinase XerD
MATIKRSKTDWLNWITGEKSSKTVESYAWQIANLAREFPGRDISRLKESDLLAFVAARRKRAGMKDEQLSDSAIKATVNALRSFYKFIGSTASDYLPMPTPKTRLQRTLTFEQSLAVLSANDSSTPIGKRNVALLSVGLDTGLRASEICRLEMTKVDLHQRVLYVVVKGGNEEPGLFSLETANYLSAWFAERERIAQCNRAFVSFELHCTGQPLTTAGLRCLFRRIGEKAGLDAFSPHDLRRTFATLQTRLGAPSRQSQVWGRWHDLKLFERYTQALIVPDIAEYDPYSVVSGVLRRGS